MGTTALTAEIRDVYDSGRFLLINPNFSAGTIRFSFVEERGVTDEIPLVNILWRAKPGADRHYAIKMQLTDPVDAAFGPVSIDCPPQTGCIYLRQITAPTCEAPGDEHLRCAACGDLVPVDPVAPLGHDYGDAQFHWADDYTSAPPPGSAHGTRAMCGR